MVPTDFLSLSCLLAFLKKQVMMNVATDSVLSASVSVKTPSILLPLLNYFTDILVVFDFHTFVFFQLYHLFPVSIILISSFVSTATSLWIWAYAFSILFWESFSNLFDVSAILFEGVTSFFR